MSVHKSIHSGSSSSSSAPTTTPLTGPQSLAYSNYKHRCQKCPAAFSKPSRLERHISLHGSSGKWKCEKCDYAVPYAATLVKHRHIHEGDTNDVAAVALADVHPMINFAQNLVPLENLTPEDLRRHREEEKLLQQQQSAGKPTSGSSRGPEDRIFSCDRCPYTHPRRDAVQSHEKRHELERSVRDGKKCPHCDYVCLQPSYLREHIRLHFEPTHDRKARLFRVFEDIEIYAQAKESAGNQEEGKILLFKDLGRSKDIKDRFVPEEEDDEFVDLYKNIDLLAKDDEDEEDEEEDASEVPAADEGEDDEDIPDSTAATAASSPSKLDMSSVADADEDPSGEAVDNEEDEEVGMEQMLVETELDEEEASEDIECQVDFTVDEDESGDNNDQVVGQESMGQEEDFVDEEEGDGY